jgi:hypothetical protein
MEEITFCMPIRDVKTRWNSTFMMLESVLRIKVPLQVIFRQIVVKAGIEYHHQIALY